jgi:hypothetical protein
LGLSFLFGAQIALIGVQMFATIGSLFVTRLGAAIASGFAAQRDFGAPLHVGV